MVLGLDAVAGLIPKIEGFAPLPSATADAFMAMQGGHMALYFGAEYTIGKRLIASMSNEEFNKSVSNPQMFINKIEPHYRVITGAFEQHINTDIDRIQNLVLEKAFDLEILKIHQNVKLLKELPSAYWEAIWSTGDKVQQIMADTEPTGKTGKTKQGKPSPKVTTPGVLTPSPNIGKGSGKGTKKPSPKTTLTTVVPAPIGPTVSIPTVKKKAPPPIKNQIDFLIETINRTGSNLKKCWNLHGKGSNTCKGLQNTLEIQQQQLVNLLAVWIY